MKLMKYGGTSVGFLANYHAGGGGGGGNGGGFLVIFMRGVSVGN